MSDQPDRALLEAKSRDDLVTMAGALGIEVAPRARKANIIDDILNGPSSTQDSSQIDETSSKGGKSVDAADSDSTEADPPEDSDESEAPKPEREADDSGVA
ncbi:MAG: hypothetical protein VX760_01930, partial [Actinomycetota bacterium]|nr:hypothetical protein [Actinomycetota bacterium]